MTKPLFSARVGVVLWAGASLALAQNSLLKVSYDPTREPYQDFNAAFARQNKVSSSIRHSPRRDSRLD